MQKALEIIGAYFFIEIIIRLLFQENYKGFRYLIVFTTFLLFLFYFHYLTWKDLNSLLIYIYILLFIVSLIFAKNKTFLFQAALFAPVIEEIICRQYIFGKLADKNLILAFFSSILFFLIFHFSKSWQQSLYIVICGLLLCFIQMKTGKVGNAIALHGLINLCMIVV